MGLKQFVKNKKKALDKVMQRVKKLDTKYISRKQYVWYREHLPIAEKTILLEALDGENPTGNIAAILDELYHNPDYADYQLYLSGKKNVAEARLAYVRAKGYDQVKLLVVDTKEYFKVLATAKFLITEVSFYFMFIKRPEQIYLNTWHGTPLKTLGKSVHNDFAMLGNVQKNFFDADYLLCPNEFTMQCLTEDYMLANFGQTKIWLTGYPRNAIFLNEARREEVRRECGLLNRQVFVFMPTWRGTMGKIDGKAQNKQLTEFLNEWDELLNEEQVLYVKLHHMNSSAIDLTGYRHIRPFPAQYDGYEFLNIADALVTDYSSVFFDYAITGKKVVLFTYDKEEYLADRGFYLSLEELPFPQVTTIPEVMKELNTPKNYEDRSFLDRFCKYDHADVTKAICRKLIFGEETPLVEERRLPDNGRKNVVIYMGNFEKNAMTTKGVEFLKQLDSTKYNYSVVYCMDGLRKQQSRLSVLPEDVAYMGFYHARSATLPEMAVYMLWRELRILPYALVSGIVKRMAEREAKRILGHRRVDAVIQFTGRNEEMLAMMEYMPCKRIVFAHDSQVFLRRGYRQMYRHVYRAYDKVWAANKEISAEIDVLTRKKKAHVSVLEHADDVIKFEE